MRKGVFRHPFKQTRALKMLDTYLSTFLWKSVDEAVVYWRTRLVTRTDKVPVTCQVFQTLGQTLRRIVQYNLWGFEAKKYLWEAHYKIWRHVRWRTQWLRNFWQGLTERVTCTFTLITSGRTRNVTEANVSTRDKSRCRSTRKTP